MPTHAEKRHMPFRQDQLFDLVSTVERYPEFLPWCLNSRIRKREGNVFWADLVIGFKMIREKFTSQVTLSAPSRIDVTYTDGPFKYLNNHWEFIPDENGTVIDFYVDFEFRSILLQKIMQPLFSEAVSRMVAAFEKRAHEMYTPQTPSA